MSSKERLDTRLKYACGLVHDNLDAKWKGLLLEEMGVKGDCVAEGVFEELPVKGEDEGAAKKVKVGAAKKGKKIASVGMRKLEKASTKGMKSIGSFFKKKGD
jgi:hypothetical protein